MGLLSSESAYMLKGFMTTWRRYLLTTSITKMKTTLFVKVKVQKPIYNNYWLPEANKSFEAYLPYKERINELPILYTVISYP